MQLIVTPAQLARLSHLYHQLGSTITAGIPLMQAVEMALNSSSSRGFRSFLAGMLARLKQGATFGESINAGGRWLAEFDVALLTAGETSGRLDTCLHQLSDYYEERARLLRSVISNLAYPMVTFHFALLVFPPDALRRLVWEGEVLQFLGSKIVLFLPLYLAVFALAVACNGRRGATWRSLLERLFGRIPLLGTARRNLALARLSAALEGLLSAGVSIVEAWELAAAASGSPALARTVQSWRASILAGITPAELVRSSGVFPDMFAGLYHSGEVSGRLDETLRRLYRHYQEEGSRKLQAVAQWTPRLIYFGILLGVAYSVVSFWLNYYGNLLNNF